MGVTIEYNRDHNQSDRAGLPFSFTDGLRGLPGKGPPRPPYLAPKEGIVLNLDLVSEAMAADSRRPFVRAINFGFAGETL